MLDPSPSASVGCPSCGTHLSLTWGSTPEERARAAQALQEHTFSHGKLKVSDVKPGDRVVLSRVARAFAVGQVATVERVIKSRKAVQVRLANGETYEAILVNIDRLTVETENAEFERALRTECHGEHTGIEAEDDVPPGGA